MPSRAVVWFRRDLRVTDHPALLAAVDAADEVVPVFVVDRTLLEGRPSGPNRRAFLLGALRALARDTAADAVWCSREHTPYARRRDAAVEQALRGAGRALHPMPGIYLSDFDELRTSNGDPFRIYSPFARAAKAAAWDDPLPAPSRVRVPGNLGPAGRWGAGEGRGAGFGVDGAVGVFSPDPALALQRLRWFAERRVDGYGRSRNYMASDGTSRLSPYLRFGLISPRQVAAAVGRGRRAAEHPRRAGDRETFVNELLWRDFYGYVLHHQPESAWEHMRPEFARFEFEDDPDGLAAWREGRTGYPLVDAGMRQLTGEGWVHNRARMVVASFLTKHLLIDWREGARFFLQHLVDGDLPSNNGGWQWVAGTGTDAAPFYRIFNPVTQAEKFDPDGDYIRRWVPELSTLDPPAIFAPWRATPADLEKAGVRLGADYPHPIVDHIAARNRARARFQEPTARRS